MVRNTEQCNVSKPQVSESMYCTALTGGMTVLEH